jgi:hypothetical protein
VPDSLRGSATAGREGVRTMTNLIELTYDAWVEQYKPVTDEDGNVRPFETYGADYETVQSVDPACVWTRCDSSGFDYISNGLHWVDRFLYYVTEVPFEAGVEVEIDLTPACVELDEHKYDERDECETCGRYNEGE